MIREGCAQPYACSLIARLSCPVCRVSFISPSSALTRLHALRRSRHTVPHHHPLRRLPRMSRKLPCVLSVWKTRCEATNTRALVSRETMGTSRRPHLHECWRVRLVTFPLMDGCADEDARTGSTMRSRDGGSLQRVRSRALARTLCLGWPQSGPELVRTDEDRELDRWSGPGSVRSDILFAQSGPRSFEGGDGPDKSELKANL